MKKINKYKNLSISTFVINLKERSERLQHIQNQFVGRHEFQVEIVEACKHPNGALGLWQSIVKIINLAQENEDDVIVICEDDHEFTKTYTINLFFDNVIEAGEQGVEVLSGGIGSFGYAVPITKNRFWINPFQSTQFIVLYKSIFPKVLAYKFKKNDVADLVIAGLTSHKMVFYPFISKQKDFGYSDITPVHNENPGLVQLMFSQSENRLRKLQSMYVKYLVK